MPPAFSIDALAKASIEKAGGTVSEVEQNVETKDSKKESEK